MGKVCPTELGCKQELSLTAALSQLSGFAPVVCQILYSWEDDEKHLGEFVAV